MNLTRQRNSDIMLVLFLIGSACGVHLFSSGIIASLYILFVCIALFKTKNIFPYLALTIFIAGSPSNFMFIKDFEIIPYVPFIMAVSLTLTLKYWSFRKMIINIYRYKKALELFIGFALLLLIIGLVFGITGDSNTGFGLMNYILIIRFFFLLPLIVLIPFLINSTKQALRLLPLLETIILVNIAFQLFYLFSGLHINELFGADNASVIGLSETFSGQQEINGRATTGWLYPLIYIPLLLVLKLFKEVSSLRFFVWINIAIFSISLTGSRGYLLAILILTIIPYYYLTTRKTFFITIIMLFLGFIFIPVIGEFSIIRGRVNLYSERFFGSEYSSSGNSTEILGVRASLGETVLEKLKESPFIGFGFSADGIKYYDQHTGNHSIALAGGLVGLFFYSGLLFYILNIAFKSSIGSNKLFLIKGLLLLSFFFIHSTSTDLFSPYFSFETYHYNKFILIAFFFTVLSTDREGFFTKNIINKHELRKRIH